MLTTALMAAALLWSQQAAPQIAAPAAPAIPDSARADPYGYERAQCSPLIRARAESLEDCQQRVRLVLAAHLGDALPDGMAPGLREERCRQEAAGDRYALQCGAPTRSTPPTPRPVDQHCQTRPRALSGGGVVWDQSCRRDDGQEPEGGLRINLGGDRD